MARKSEYEVGDRVCAAVGLEHANRGDEGTVVVVGSLGLLGADRYDVEWDRSGRVDHNVKREWLTR